MRKIIKLISVFSFVVSFSTNLFAQITPNGNSGTSTTVYTNGAPNNPIYIWCAEGLANNTASLTATPASGTGPFTFNWYYHDQTNFSWTPYISQTGATSTLNNLPSDGYRVDIYDASSTLVGCSIAWVWNMNSTISASQNPTACNASNLSGAISSNSSFTYYNPPPAESLINSSTQITVCFTANHTFVSDVGFYLVGPAACGSPTILLSPNPGANGQGSVCNSGNNISNLCFSSSSFSIIDVCTAAVPLSGTFGGFGATATMINWAPLIGCNAAEGGWRVQIYDCIGADVGALTNANITFSNLVSVCGSPTSITYSSGAINSPINDNSCSAATASIFQVPVNNLLTTPITINAAVSYLWTASPVIAIPNATSSLTPAVTNLPNGNTMFYLTETVSYGGTSCTYLDSTQFTNTCCTVVADAGLNVNFCTGGNSQIGTPAVAGMTYLWSPAVGLNNATNAQPIATLTNVTGAPVVSTYTLTITNTAGGCTATDAVDVTVNPNPTVVDPTDQSLCANTSVTAINFSGNGLSTVYNWTNSTPSIGLVGSGSGNITSFSALNSGSTPIVATITVTPSLNGCTGLAQTFTITVNPTPTVIDPADQAICANTAASAVNFSGNSVSTAYNWTNSTPSIGLAGAGSGNIASFTATNSGSSPILSTITVTPSLGLCVGSAQVFTITVNPIPVFTAALTTNPSACLLSDGSITLNTGLNPSTPYTFGYVDDGVPVGPLTIISNAGGTYVLTGLNAGTYSNFSIFNGTCSYTFANSIVLTDPLAPNLIITNPAAVCAPSTVNITLPAVTVGTSNPGVLTYWTDNAATISLATATAITASGTYYIQATNAGCTDIAAVLVTVTPLPTMTDPSDQVLCANTMTTAVNFSGANPSNVYTWTNNSPSIGLLGNGTGNIAAFNTANAGITAVVATLNVTPSVGVCNGTPQSFTITVNPVPTVVDPANQTLCANASTTAINFTGNSGSTVYNWVNSSTNIGLAANGSGNIAAFSALNGGNTPNVATITVTPTLGSCIGSAQTFTITVNPLPIISAGIDQTVCLGTNIILSGSGGATYTWNNGVINGQSFPSVIGTTVYTVTGTDANGCVNTDNVSTNVVLPPIASIIPDVTAGYPGLIVNFINNSENASTYNWVLGNGGLINVTTLASQTTTYSEPGTYTVMLTASNGVCNDVTTLQIIVMPFPPPIIHVPNVFTPNHDGANDEFFIETSLAVSMKVIILNRWGNVVHEINDLTSKWNGEINGKEASEGVYFFKYEVLGLNGDLVSGHGNITLIR
jgi:gliding motility-associated-like protein